MKLRLVMLVCMLAGMGSVGRAQFGVYGKFDFTHASAGVGLVGSSSSSSSSFTGGGVGIYDDFFGLGPVRLGLDLRGNFEAGNNQHYRAILGGVRLAVKVPVVGLKPYVQGSIGVGGTRSDGPFAAGISDVPYSRKLTYEGLAGVDWRVLPHVDWRVVELGVGRQSPVQGSAVTLFTAGTGAVVRF